MAKHLQNISSLQMQWVKIADELYNDHHGERYPVPAGINYAGCDL